jgi:type I restriction enzyme S subunit
MADSSYKTVEIGPKEFKVPESWELMKIPEVCDLTTERFNPDEHDQDTFEYIDIESVSPGKIDDSKTVRVEDAPSRAKQIVELGDTLIGKVRPYLRAFAPVTKQYDKVVCSTGFAVLSAKDEVDPDYLTQATLSKYFVDQMTNRTTGTSYPAVNNSDFESVQIFVPPLPEQRRIASVLSKVDERIQETQHSIEDTEELRDGLIQDLVLGKGLADDYKEVRIGAKREEIPLEWEVKTFSEIADVEKGDTPKTSNQSYYGGDITWVTPDDLSTLYKKGRKYISDSERKLTQEGLESTSVNIVGEPCVMFTSRSYGIGKTAICTTPAATNQGIIAFCCGDEMGEEYLYYYLNYIMPYIISISGVSTFPEVSLTDIRELKVPVPPETDRKYIEKVLTTVDEKVVDEKSTKQALYELKRGLMQDLLTGERRLKKDT